MSIKSNTYFYFTFDEKARLPLSAYDLTVRRAWSLVYINTNKNNLLNRIYAPLRVVAADCVRGVQDQWKRIIEKKSDTYYIFFNDTESVVS